MRIVLDSLNIDQMQRVLVVAALEKTGSVVEAAQLLGVTQRAVSRLIAKHKIEWPRAVQSS